MKKTTPALRPCASSTLFAVLLTASAIVLADSPPQTEQASNSGNNWHTLEVKTEVDGEEQTKGHVLFTTNTEATGVAFRCEKGKLIALVSAKPLDFERMLELRFRGSEDWEVSFTLNGGDEQNEEWVQMYRGRIFMVKKLATTRQLFELANTKGSLEFTRKYGKPVTVTLPEAERDVFDEFLQGCKLQEKYLPQLHAASGNAPAPKA